MLHQYDPTLHSATVLRRCSAFSGRAADTVPLCLRTAYSLLGQPIYTYKHAAGQPGNMSKYVYVVVCTTQSHIGLLPVVPWTRP